jgi:hypothetical protein
MVFANLGISTRSTQVRSLRTGPFDTAQDRPIDTAQDRPIDTAQDRPEALSYVVTGFQPVSLTTQPD